MKPGIFYGPAMSQSNSLTEPIYSSLGGDPNLAEIVDMFVEEMPDRIARLLDLHQSAAWKGLRRVAHQLKGAAGSYGFDSLSPCAARLEQAVREEATEDQIRLAVGELVNLCRRVTRGTPTQGAQ